MIRKLFRWLFELLGGRIRSQEEIAIQDDVNENRAALRLVNSKIKELEESGVDDLSLEEEVNYWKEEE